MKRLTVLGLALAALLVPVAVGGSANAPKGAGAPARGGWWSESFVSPTHNIHCRWFYTKSLMACTAQNKDHMLAVTVWGNPWHRTTTAGYVFPSGPKLYYGQTYTGYDANDNAVVRCWSRSTGMTCRSLKTNRGFFLNRDECKLL